MNQAKPRKTTLLLALLLVQLLFAVNFVASKIILEVIPALAWASFRNFVAGVVLLLTTLVLRRPFPAWKSKHFLQLILYSSLAVVISQSSFLVGLHYTTVTNSSVLTTLIPVFTLLLLTLCRREPISPIRKVGFFVALVGVLIIRKVEDFTLSDQTLWGDSLTLVNCVSYSLFLTIGKKFMEENDPFWTTTALFLIGGMGLIVISIPELMRFQMPPLSVTLIECMIFSTLGSTVIAYFLNFWVLGNLSSSLVALFIYLQPIFASLVCWIIFGQLITTRTFFSGFLIFLGMILAIRGGNKLVYKSSGNHNEFIR